MTKVARFIKYSRPTPWTYALTLAGIIAIAVSYVDRLVT